MVADKNRLLPYIDTLSRRYDFAALVPTSAKRRQGTDVLAAAVAAQLSSTAKCFEHGGENDREFMFAELLREKIFHCLGDELPHRIGVVVHSKEKPHSDMLHVDADIYVEKESQKAIVIGGGGLMIKKIATWARKDMERLSGRRIFLESRVRVRLWRNDKSLLSAMRVGAGNI